MISLYESIKNNSNNHSSNFGGAIYIKNGTLNITSGTFEENKTNKNYTLLYAMYSKGRKTFFFYYTLHKKKRGRVIT